MVRFVVGQKTAYIQSLVRKRSSLLVRALTIVAIDRLAAGHGEHEGEHREGTHQAEDGSRGPPLARTGGRGHGGPRRGP